MYLRWQSLPELADLSGDQRKELWREARRDPFRPTDLAWLFLLFLVNVPFVVALILLPKSLSIWIALPAWIAASFIMGQIMNAILICRYRPVVRRLRSRGG
jgi:hypothetical protein